MGVGNIYHPICYSVVFVYLRYMRDWGICQHLFPFFPPPASFPGNISATYEKLKYSRWKREREKERAPEIVEAFMSFVYVRKTLNIARRVLFSQSHLKILYLPPSFPLQLYLLSISCTLFTHFSSEREGK